MGAVVVIRYQLLVLRCRSAGTVGALARSSAVGDVGEAGTGLYVKS